MGRTVYFYLHEWLNFMVNVGVNIPVPWMLWVVSITGNSAIVTIFGMFIGDAFKG